MGISTQVFTLVCMLTILHMGLAGPLANSKQGSTEGREKLIEQLLVLGSTEGREKLIEQLLAHTNQLSGQKHPEGYAGGRQQEYDTAAPISPKQSLLAELKTLIFSRDVLNRQIEDFLFQILDDEQQNLSKRGEIFRFGKK